MTNEKLSPIQNRIIIAATGIMADHEPLIEYQHSLFCQVALPRSRPESRVFERSYRQGSIRIEAGVLWNGKTWVEQPVPAGPKPRLALIHINSEAVRTRCPVVEVERSARKFMERLGLNTDGGKDYNLFKRAMMALAACRMALGFGGEDRPVTVDTKPIRRFEAWITNDDQPVLWPGEIELSREYFDDLLEHAVPLDGRAVRALTHSGPAGAFKQKGTVSLWKNAFAAPSPSFLICRTGFLVISKYIQYHICDITSLFHDYTTCCHTKRYT